MSYKILTAEPRRFPQPPKQVVDFCWIGGGRYVTPRKLASAVPLTGAVVPLVDDETPHSSSN